MKLSRYEQETIFIYNQEDATAEVYTCNPSLMRRLDVICVKSPLCTVVKTDEHSKTYNIPKKWIKVRMPPVYSEETKLKMQGNFKRKDATKNVREL